MHLSISGTSRVAAMRPPKPYIRCTLCPGSHSGRECIAYSDSVSCPQFDAVLCGAATLLQDVCRIAPLATPLIARVYGLNHVPAPGSTAAVSLHGVCMCDAAGAASAALSRSPQHSWLPLRRPLNRGSMCACFLLQAHGHGVHKYYTCVSRCLMRLFVP